MAAGGIPPSPSQNPATAEIWACQKRLVDKALAESCSTALADMLDYIERQAQLALETSGDTISRWVDTYA